MAPLSVGSFVLLKGLSSSAQFNGLTGIIRRDKNADQRYGVQLLDHGGDGESWKGDAAKRCGGRVLNVKTQNLKPSARDSPHWRSADIGGHSVLELVRADARLRGMDLGDKFVQAVWDRFFETAPAQTLTIDHGLRMRAAIVGAVGRKMYFIELAAVQHYLLIEKCRGRYRIYQSKVRIKNSPGGYSAGEWCTLGGLPVEMKAHWVYAGGLTFGDVEINNLLDWVVELQGLVKTLTPHLLRHVEGIEPAAAALLAQDLDSLSLGDGDLATEARKVALSWSSEVDGKVAPLGLTTHLPVSKSDPVKITQAGRLLFEIPGKLYRRVGALFENLTGQTTLNPVVFVRMVNMGIWWENLRNPEDGGALGFTIRMADLNLPMSHEEGVAAVKEMTDNAKRCLNGSQMIG